MDKSEIVRLQTYLRNKFGNEKFALIERKETNDSVEVLLGGEFIGIIYRDDDDADEISYDFNMAILAQDLPKSA